MESRYKLTMCRLCFCENECYLNIFEVNDWQGYVPAEVISDLLQFQVSKTDAYPHVVCSTCLTKLTEFKLFKECCQKSKDTYDNMFVSRESPEEYKPEMVEVIESQTSRCSSAIDNPTPSNDEVISSGISVKVEPLEVEEFEFQESNRLSKALIGISTNSIEISDDFESELTIKEEPLPDVVDGVSGSELSKENSLREASSDVEFVAAKAEPSYHSDNEDNVSKTSNDLDGTARDEFKEDIIYGVHCSEFSKEDPLRDASSGVQLRHEDEVAHPQYFQCMEHKRPHCGSNGYFDAHSCIRNINTSEESIFGKSKNISLSIGIEASSSKTMDGLEGQWIFAGERIYMAPIFQEDVGFRKEGVKERWSEKNMRGGEGNGRMGTGSEKRLQEENKRLKCSHCGKVLKTKRGLIGHMKLHGFGQTYDCDFCKKALQSKIILKNHIRIHTGAKPYKCAECCKTFSENSNLKRHIRLHTGFKPYKCGECSKSFSLSDSLKRHINTHTGSKPYQCEECGKTFNENGSLKRHIRSHTGSKPYKCGECNISFSQSCSLKRHIKNKHMFQAI